MTRMKILFSIFLLSVISVFMLHAEDNIEQIKRVKLRPNPSNGEAWLVDTYFHSDLNASIINIEQRPSKKSYSYSYSEQAKETFNTQAENKSKIIEIILSEESTRISSKTDEEKKFTLLHGSKYIIKENEDGKVIITKENSEITEMERKRVAKIDLYSLIIPNKKYFELGESWRIDENDIANVLIKGKKIRLDNNSYANCVLKEIVEEDGARLARVAINITLSGDMGLSITPKGTMKSGYKTELKISGNAYFNIDTKTPKEILLNGIIRVNARELDKKQQTELARLIFSGNTFMKIKYMIGKTH